MEKTDPKKVLVVEDDSVMRELEVRELKLKGYEVFEAADGVLATDSILKNKPDLILLDLMLPKKDGFAVLEEMRKLPDSKIAATPVIVLSNLWSDKDILRTQSMKIDGYFVKANSTLGEVMQKVSDVIHRS